MLHKEELSLNFKTLQLISLFNFLPIKFCPNTGIVSFQTSRLRLGIWKTQFTLYTLNDIWKHWSLLRTRSDLNIFSINCIYCAVANAIWYELLYIFYRRGPENAYLITLINERRFQKSQYEGPKISLLQTTISIFRRPIRETVIITLPFALYGFGLSWIGLCLLEPYLGFWIFSILPGNFQHGLISTFMFIYEVWSVLLICSSAYLCSYTVLNVIPRLTVDVLGFIAAEISGLENQMIPLTELSRICMELRMTQIEIKLLNYVYSGFNYVVKLTFLFVSIAGLFTGIKHFGDNPLFTLLSAILAMYIITLFLFFFGDMYKIPEIMDCLKERLGIVSRTMKCPESVYTRKIVASIPQCGIRAGNFYILDRMTSLVFLNYVLYQVAGLLIASK
ncbi:unnamed protein product [Allacma fusca]|uniref:Uncharacterized protein n=1 Tax=Allacma fusca TaxID=39272 RepID=A0A8J2LRA8_9HEXA|nr:unnamed protein product [Allacma fusca]